MNDLKNWRVTIYRTLGLIFIAAVCGIAFNQLSPKGLYLITPFHRANIGNQQLKVPVFLSRKLFRQQSLNLIPHQQSEYQLDETYKHFQDCSALFIDARTSEEYLKGHIPQAVSIPLESFDYQKPVLVDFPVNHKIITYCEGESCSESIDLAVHLNELGFTDVCIFVGGWEKWQAAGYPVKEGDQP
jgi:rhodanese-related sulfurtransferase